MNRRLLRPSDVRMTAPVSYFSSGPLEARDSIRVHGQWRLEVLAPAAALVQAYGMDTEKTCFMHGNAFETRR
jgi:hypothetical protein